MQQKRILVSFDWAIYFDLGSGKGFKKFDKKNSIFLLNIWRIYE
ncbi:hypothetical protein R83H12_03117 [Fibrobacteria bacterium R8-3-H12]